MGKISLSPAERMTSYAMRDHYKKMGQDCGPPVMFVYIPYQQCYIMLYLPQTVEFSHKATERYLRGLRTPSCVNVHVIFRVQNQHLFHGTRLPRWLSFPWWSGGPCLSSGCATGIRREVFDRPGKQLKNPRNGTSAQEIGDLGTRNWGFSHIPQWNCEIYLESRINQWFSHHNTSEIYPQYDR